MTVEARIVRFRLVWFGVVWFGLVWCYDFDWCVWLFMFCWPCIPV